MPLYCFALCQRPIDKHHYICNTFHHRWIDISLYACTSFTSESVEEPLTYIPKSKLPSTLDACVWATLAGIEALCVLCYLCTITPSIEYLINGSVPSMLWSCTAYQPYTHGHAWIHPAPCELCTATHAVAASSECPDSRCSCASACNERCQ